MRFRKLLHLLVAVSLLTMFGVFTASAQEPTDTPEQETELIVHVVEEGETLESIALYYEIEISELLAANGLEIDAEIAPGQELVIPVAEPTEEVIEEPTEEVIEEPTEEVIEEPTEVPTEEPTEVPPVERVAEPPVEDADIGAQAASGSWVSMFQVLNMSLSESAPVVVNFYAEATGNVDATLSGDTIPAGGVIRYDMAKMGDLPDGWRGSAVVESSAPLAVAVNQVTTTSPKFAGAYTGLMYGAPKWYFPSLLRNYYSWNNTLAVQNAGSVDVDFTISVYNSNGKVVATKGDTLPPNAAKFYDFSTSAWSALGNGFTGSAVVEADDGTSPLATVLLQEAVGGFTQSFEGFTSGATTLFAPGLYNGYYQWNSSINIQNVDTADASVTVKYSDGKVVKKTLKPGTSVLLYQPVEGHPGGWNGGATITSNRSIVAIVNSASGLQQAQTYSAVGSGAQTVGLPIIPRNDGGWLSSFTVMNVDSATANYTIHYSNGKTKTGSLTVNQSKEYFMPAQSEVPSTFAGGAVVESTNGRNIAIIVNQTYQNQAGGDWSMSYNGVVPLAAP